jgi:hypothetical protein
MYGPQPTSDSPVSAASMLRCQWCFVALPVGATTCPACGSAGVPDPRMQVPGADDAPVVPVDPLAAPTVPEGVTKLDEWWNEAVETGDQPARKPRLTYEDVEQRRMQTLAFIAFSVVLCAVIGWLAGPLVLQGPMEALSGTEVADPNDLRGMGAFLGLLAGFLVGATGGWVVWSSR